MGFDLPAKNELSQPHIMLNAEWADQEVSFFGSCMRGFKNAAVESFDAKHWLGTAGNLALSAGIGLAMARFAPARGALGVLARAGGAAMALSFASQLLTTGKEGISGALNNSSKSGHLVGRLAFDTLLMTAGGVGGQKLGSKFFAVRQAASLPRNEYLKNGLPELPHPDYQGRGWLGNEVWSPRRTASLLENAPKTTATPMDVVSRTNSPAMVRVIADQGIGSGFFIKQDGKIATAFHVIGNLETGALKGNGLLAGNFKVLTADGKVYSADVVGINQGRDVAILQIGTRSTSSNAPAFPILELAKGRRPEINSAVHSLGHAGGLPELTVLPLKVRDSSIGYRFAAEGRTQNGMSGGPIVDTENRVVALLSCGNCTSVTTKAWGPDSRSIRALLHAVEENSSRRLLLWNRGTETTPNKYINRALWFRENQIW